MLTVTELVSGGTGIYTQVEFRVCALDHHALLPGWKTSVLAEKKKRNIQETELRESSE